MKYTIKNLLLLQFVFALWFCIIRYCIQDAVWVNEDDGCGWIITLNHSVIEKPDTISIAIVVYEQDNKFYRRLTAYIGDDHAENCVWIRRPPDYDGDKPGFFEYDGLDPNYWHELDRWVRFILFIMLTVCTYIYYRLVECRDTPQYKPKMIIYKNEE